MQMAVSALLNINRLGTYVVVARVEGGEAKRISFNAVPGPFFLNQAQAGGA